MEQRCASVACDRKARVSSVGRCSPGSPPSILPAKRQDGAGDSTAAPTSAIATTAGTAQASARVFSSTTALQSRCAWRGVPLKLLQRRVLRSAKPPFVLPRARRSSSGAAMRGAWSCVRMLVQASSKVCRLPSALQESCWPSPNRGAANPSGGQDGARGGTGRKCNTVYSKG